LSQIRKTSLLFCITYSTEIRVVFLFPAGIENLLRNVPVRKVREFQVEYVDFLKNKHPEVMAALKSGKIDDSLTGVLKQVATDLASKYN
jgi:F-type H+-transporting ATPase subunit alpha